MLPHSRHPNIATFSTRAGSTQGSLCTVLTSHRSEPVQSPQSNPPCYQTRSSYRA